MKRLMLTLLVAQGLSIATRAGAGEVRGGLWVGPNLSTLHIEGVPGDATERRTAVAFGALLAWRPRESWSLEVRPSYVGRGAKVLISGTQGSIRASYLEIPLLITGDLGAGRVRPYLLAGAALGRRSSARAVFAETEQDISDDFESVDATLRLGAGVRLHHAAGRPFAEIEYVHGFKDLNARRAGFGSEVGAIHNRGVQIRAGISFGLGGK